MPEENSPESSIFSPEQILQHAQHIQNLHRERPGYIVRYLTEFLNNAGDIDPEVQQIQEVEWIINKNRELLEYEAEHFDEVGLSEGLESEKLKAASEELNFRREIERYYLPHQLVDAIIENGAIPENSIETPVGVGFLDIADYTYLSKFLSPKENQMVLNGLYTAFHWVLKRHGGYLNKIEGDSIMFHYGGLIDPKVRDLTEKETKEYIARELFYTCVEMQRVCSLFNQANDRFLYDNRELETREAIQNAFEIIKNLRSSVELAPSINALFQIRVRIGANVGEVSIGNFGPSGAKQWDVIGLPVIHAKRMEATAPIGGLRISREMYQILEETGIADAYYQRFKREAQALFGIYKSITKEELYKNSLVILKDKKNVTFDTYSVQVNPGLPEDIMRQTEFLLAKGEHGADKILELLRYYRGNKFVISAVESVFQTMGVILRKSHMIRYIYPEKYKAYMIKLKNDKTRVEQYINDHYDLFDIFDKLGS